MAERQDWPSWRFGPHGEAQVFAREADVPEGWVTHPSKLPPAKEQLPENVGGEAEALRESARLRVENVELRGKLARLEADLEGVNSSRASMAAEIAQLRKENERLKAQAAIVAPLARQEPPDQPRSVRRPRKLHAGSGTPFTPGDESVTLDEGRRERLAVLRDAGVAIADDATDGEIEAALDRLEQQED